MTGYFVPEIIPPAACETKDQVRAELDRIDNQLILLFAERHQYVSRVAQLKTDPHEAFDPVRIEAMIKRLRAKAEAEHLDEDQVELIWRTLINWNVNFEKGVISARNKG